MKARAPLRLALAAALLAAAAPASAATHRVAAGESIQEALDGAAPGDVVEVEPGVYHEALVVETPDLTLRGLASDGERPVLDGRGELHDAVIATASPFAMTGFRVQHYLGNGVTAQRVRGVVLSDLVVDDTGLYGLYPVQSRDITITHCTVSRISDAAIYVGESEEAVVAHNEVRDSVAGIQLENTNDAEVHDNLAWKNTAGILVFVVPGKVQKEGRRVRLRRNWVLENDTENFGDPESLVGSLPRGIGIMVMGADRTLVEGNTVKGNDSVGVWLARLGAERAEQDPELDPLPDHNRVEGNYLLGNGGSPHPELPEALASGADLAWDGTGRGNCALLRGGALRAGEALPACEGPAPAGAAEPAAAEGAAEGADAVVRIRGMRYHPKHLTVRAGDSVAWVNEDAVTHTVTSGEGTRPTHSPLSSGFLRRGERFVHTFEEAGRYEYLCLPHLNQASMRGATVTVEE